MGGVGSLQPDAVVRPPAVVEEDEALNLLQSLPVRPETPVLTVGALALDGAVFSRFWLSGAILFAAPTYTTF